MSVTLLFVCRDDDVEHLNNSGFWVWNSASDWMFTISLFFLTGRTECCGHMTAVIDNYAFLDAAQVVIAAKWMLTKSFFLFLFRWRPSIPATHSPRCPCHPPWRTASSWLPARPASCCPWTPTSPLTSSHPVSPHPSKSPSDGKAALPLFPPLCHNRCSYYIFTVWNIKEFLKMCSGWYI